MAKKNKNPLPNYFKLMRPTLHALVKLGGSGTNDEINETVYQICQFSDEALTIPHGKNGLTSEIDYRLFWTRTYLKKANLIQNSSRGVWTLVDSHLQPDKVDIDTIVKNITDELKKNRTEMPTSADQQDSSTASDNVAVETEAASFVISEDPSELDWKEKLLQTLQSISPAAFERLAQRLLRESGFIQVEVTGKSNDGGIDGKGIVKINGLLSFHIIFQCKRYKGSVGSSQIRDFRGAMQGRADKGMIITTGTFTREAVKEATRPGADPIDLIDGEQLCDKLKELGLGVKTVLVEQVEIQRQWFLDI
ncbi:MAG: restriction endonuclease [Chitinophagales bacterium]|jgi:restriction system protein|nr:restriction endonuclease [Chitinophagales bacterium]